MRPTNGFEAPRALYIHVPFCASKCAYCDFYSLPGAAASGGLVAAYVDRVLEGLDAALLEHAPAAWPAYETIYVGGGTPSALPSRELSRLLSGIAQRAGRPAEWTMEANPESLSGEVLDVAEAAGVDRISLGVQSLDDGLLTLLGRRADAATCESALSLLRSRPALRASADLIAGLPRSRPLAEEAARLVGFGLGHLSVYDLVLEEGSPLEAMVSAGRVRIPEEDESWAERREAEDFLAGAGLARYEVSNFAREGEECLHNLSYWHLDSYVGIGPGAVSTLRRRDADGLPAGSRGATLRVETGRDLEAFAAGRLPPALTGIGPRDSLVEAVMMAMRTAFGLGRRTVEERFGLDPFSLLGRTLEAWSDHLAPGRPWPRRAGGAGLALDSGGLDLLNRFLVDCISDIDRAFAALPQDNAAAAGSPEE